MKRSGTGSPLEDLERACSLTLNINLETNGHWRRARPPTTPFALVHAIVEAAAGPATSAAPVHTVPSVAVPENLNSPLNDDPLTAPLICPPQPTDVESQLPLTSDPD